MRVVIADDSLLTRTGISTLLRDHGCEVVAEVGDGDAALAAVRRHTPDVAILDIRMPPTHTDEGLSAAVQIRAECPATAVLVLSHYVQPSYALRLIGTYPGGMGYLLKDRVTDSALLLDGLRRLTDGECVIDPTIVARCIRERNRGGALDVLTDRERDVLAQIAEGRSNTGIAKNLYIAERTVETHTTQIFQKLGLHSTTDTHRRVLAVLKYLRSTDRT
jgi:DNA-binding NarL/FixJ family response regulator